GNSTGPTGPTRSYLHGRPLGRRDVKSQTLAVIDAAAAGAGVTIALCFTVAVLEGVDIQVMGVAAPKLGAELQLARDTLGRALSASNIGLVLGATLGGWLADRLGRKPV